MAVPPVAVLSSEKLDPSTFKLVTTCVYRRTKAKIVCINAFGIKFHYRSRKDRSQSRELSRLARLVTWNIVT